MKERCSVCLGAIRRVDGRLEHVKPGNHEVVILDPSKGEFLDEQNRVRTCRACLPNPKVRRHICGLAELQRMFTL